MTSEPLNIAVLFDTNSYRQLTLNKSKSELKESLRQLRKFESKKNIKAYSIFIVIAELLANVAEGKNGINYKNCVQSLVFLGNHCYNSNNKTISIIPPPYIHVINNVFDALPIDYQTSTKKLSDFINKFRTYNGVPPNNQINRTIFDNLKYRIQSEEQDFSHNIIRLINSAKTIVKDKYPKTSDKHLKTKLLDYLKSEEFDQTIAMSMLSGVSDTLDIKLTQNELYKRAIFLRSIFPFSISFLKWVMYKIVWADINMQSKTSINKRWNWIWDYQVSYMLTDKTLENRKIILVTSDNDIKEMNSEYGFEKKVIILNEYFDFIKN